MKTKLLIAALFCSLAIGPAYAADEPAPFEKFVADYGLIVRKSLENKNLVNAPAALSWSNPEGAASSTMIDIGIGLKLWESAANPDRPWDIMPKVEYHKNTEVGSKQDTFKGGFSYSQMFGAESDWTNYCELSATYKNDRIKTGQGFSGSLSYTATYAPLHLGYAGMGDVAYMLTPRIAMQGEQADDLVANAPSGSVTRLKGSLELALYPFNGKLKKGVELLVGYQVWSNLSRSGPFVSYKKNQELFTASLNVYLDREQRFALGLDYSDGENPEEGQADQTVTSLSFKVKLGK